MPSVNPSAFGPKPAFFDASGNPDLSYKLFAYVAGSTSTKQNTYTDSTGNVANPNPIILNALGQTPNGFWWTSGQIYKIVLAPATDTDPPTNPIWTVDNLQGMNDADAAAAADEWQLFSSAPTFVNATSFTLKGNQTDVFQVGRRIKTMNTAGLAYSTITGSVFTSSTTVTVTNTFGVLDAGLSAVYYGILSVLNPSYPGIFTQPITMQGASIIFAKGADIPSAATVNLVTATGNTVNLTGTTAVTAWTMLTGQRMRVQFTAATPITYNAVTNQIQGGSSITGEIGSYLEIYYDGTTTFVTYVLVNGAAASGPSFTTVPAPITATGATLTNNAVGVPTKINSASATATALMAVSTLIIGQSFTLTNIGAGIATFNRVGSDTITGGNLTAATAISLNQGESVTLTCDSASTLVVTASNVPFFGPPRTRQDVTASRVLASTYVNNTGRTIDVSVICGTGGNGAAFFINSTLWNQVSFQGLTNGLGWVGGQVLPGENYGVTGSFSKWSELR